MSTTPAQVTEDDRKLALAIHKIADSGGHLNAAAQLIADSKARAIVAAYPFHALELERDQLHAEVERLRAPSTIVAPGSEFCERDYHTLKARAERSEREEVRWKSLFQERDRLYLTALNDLGSMRGKLGQSEAELDAIKRGHGELGRYEKLRLKNAALTAELAQEKAAHAGTHMLLDAREDELFKERARFDWIFHYTEVTHLINPSIPLDTISAIDKAMGNP